MAIWPFNRNRQKSSEKRVPEEVEQYYQSERRDRVGVAWLLAGLTLVVTVFIVLGLFFGGRWIYRKIANKDDTSTQTAQTNQPAEQSPASQQPSSNNNSGTSSGGGTPSTPTNNQGSTGQGTVTAPTQANNPSSVSSQPTQTSNLADTGPGETIAVFVLVSLAGYLGYSSYLKRKLN